MRSADDTKPSMTVTKRHNEIRTQNYLIKWENLRDSSKEEFSRG